MDTNSDERYDDRPAVYAFARTIRSSADRPPPPPKSTASTAADLVDNDSSATSERVSGPFSDENTITGYRRPRAR